MKKKRFGHNIIAITMVTIIFIIIYLIIEYLAPIMTDLIIDYKTKNNNLVSNLNRIQKLEILYDDYQKLLQMHPNINFKGRIYYNLYGKKVYDEETFVNLSDVKIDEDLANKLLIMPNIKEVDLHNQNLTNDEKVALKEAVPNVVFKWTVDLLGENVDSSIESLDLSNKKIPDIEAFKKSITLLPNLKKIDLSYSNLSNEELGNLRTLFPNIRIDWVVFLGKWSLRTDSVAFSVLITKYDYRRMTSEDIQVLKYCTELQALDLGHQAIEDISVIGDYLPNLRVLILADNKIKDISPLAKLKHLHYLELFMNDITDATPLAECKEMVDLNISFNYRFSNIDGILNYPLLERLWLISDRISADSYNKIRETYPNVKLITTGKGSTNSGWRTHERYFAMIDMYRNNYISELFTKFDNAIPNNEN